jgi:hypothetical protein
MDHAGAVAACASSGMTLVHINDQAENAFVESTVVSDACCALSLASDYHWAGLWIGAGDPDATGDWRWEDDQSSFWQGLADGMAVGGAFASWAIDQPNNGNLGPDEYCVRTTGAVWNDTPCELDAAAQYPFDGIGYICES